MWLASRCPQTLQRRLRFSSLIPQPYPQIPYLNLRRGTATFSSRNFDPHFIEVPYAQREGDCRGSASDHGPKNRAGKIEIMPRPCVKAALTINKWSPHRDF